jgi:hypothetical protein
MSVRLRFALLYSGAFLISGLLVLSVDAHGACATARESGGLDISVRALEGEDRIQSPPLSIYSEPGGLRQDPGNAA